MCVGEQVFLIRANLQEALDAAKLLCDSLFCKDNSTASEDMDKIYKKIQINY